MTIRRAFIDLPHGQIHYRTAGQGRPLLLLHPSPGSSRQMVPLIYALAPGHRVIAADTPGNGDSPPLPNAAPAIADYAACLPALLDGLGLDSVDVYGSHTGASIAAELAIALPDRVGKIILDGVGVFAPDERDELLARYAHPFPPDLDGAYLMRAFHFCRDQYLFYPWYDRTRHGRRDGGLRPAGDLHAWLVEVLKAAETYHLAYRAAFAWDAAGRLPLVGCPALVMAAQDDPLFTATQGAAALMPSARFAALPRLDAPDFAAQRTALITDFLNA
jgi:pimeloyl-ACP methyl ester carboxylesterase